MKPKNIKSFALIALPLFAISLLVNTNNNEQYQKVDSNNDIAKISSIYMTPSVDRYGNDYINEPDLYKAWTQNFRYMGLGGDEANESHVWNNYRGETLDGKKVTVCVIDTGLDIFHQEFLKPEAQGKLININNVGEYSIVDKNSASIYVTEAGTENAKVHTDVGLEHIYEHVTYDYGYERYSSHGTSVAASAVGSINGANALGVAPNANLLFIKTDLNALGIIASIRYAYEHGADVINMSFGGYAESFTDDNGNFWLGDEYERTIYNEVIKEARDAGTVLVAAAGNEKTGRNSYPASCPGVIGVGALKKKQGSTPADFSNFNNAAATKDSDNNVDVMAPGYVATPNVPQDGPRSLEELRLPDSDMEYTLGTSFASPLTAGLVALYRGKYPDRTPAQVEEALFNSTVDIGDAGWDHQFGYGRVDAQRFLNDDELPTSVSIVQKGITLVGTIQNPYPAFTPDLEFKPANASTAHQRGSWSSSDPSILQIDASTGYMVALKSGNVTISYTTDLDGLVATTSVNITNVNEFTGTPEINYPYGGVRFKVDDETHYLKELTYKGPLMMHNTDTSCATMLEDFTMYGHKQGETTLVLSVLDKKLEITLSTYKYQLTSLFVEENEKYNNIPLGGEFPYASIVLFASYSNGQTEEVDYYITHYADTSYIGHKQYDVHFYEYGMVGQALIDYYVTNVGAEQIIELKPLESQAVPYDYYYFNDNNSIVGMSYPGCGQWRLTHDNDNDTMSYAFDDASYASVIGDETNHPNNINIYTDSLRHFAIDSVALYVRGKGATVSVTVNEAKFKVEGQESFTLTSDTENELVFFKGTADKAETINIDITGIKGTVYIGVIAVFGPEQEIPNFDYSQQATSFFLEAVNYSSCASSWTDADRANIKQLVIEYNAMLQGSKDDALMNTVFEDNGGYSTSMTNKMKMIVKEYNKTLKPGEEKLELVLKEASNGNKALVYTGEEESIFFNNESNMILALVIITLSALGIGTLILIKRRRA